MTARKTASASEFYFGNDTFGRQVELARRATDGQWFVRFGNSRSMGRWVKHTNEVVHPTTVENVYTGEIITHSAETSASLVQWGFQTLRAASATSLRLPL
jgi:hypothetical protein